MWNEPTQERLDKIPRIYDTEHIPLEDKIVHLHFFIGSCDWYITEFDGEDLFFGYAILNQDYWCAEWGYISFKELKEISIDGIEIDCEHEAFWNYPRAIEVENIRRGMNWPLPRKEAHVRSEGSHGRDACSP